MPSAELQRPAAATVRSSLSGKPAVSPVTLMNSNLFEMRRVACSSASSGMELPTSFTACPTGLRISNETQFGASAGLA